MEGKEMQLIVITGLSGAGKSQALQSLEDLGFFCVDNLPPTFIVKFAELCAQSNDKVSKAAIVCDLRGGEFFTSLAETLVDLEQEGFRYQILFLEASDEVLVRRYKESRRRHPLTPQGRVLDGIQMERQQLAELRDQADLIIDTSEVTAQQLRQMIGERFTANKTHSRMAVSVISFGFKYGIPLDADLIVDVRFLPNPFYVQELRPLTGEHPLVQDYIFTNPVAQEFMSRYLDLLSFVLPHYEKEGKSHLVIGVGCTGGQHRSVAIAEKLSGFLTERQFTPHIKHRDVGKGRKSGTGR